MNITIQNLGAIHKASVDIKPLTVFVGANGTGKTWFAYTLAGIFGAYGWKHFSRAYAAGDIKLKYQLVENAVDQFIATGNAQVDVVEFAKSYATVYFTDLAHFTKEWMGRFFNTDKIDFSQLLVDVIFSDPEFQSLIKAVQEIELDDDEGVTSADDKKPLLHAVKETNLQTVYFYASSGFLDKLPKSRIRRFVISNLFQLLHRALHRFVYVLPTERTTFITMPFLRSTAANSVSSANINKASDKQEPPSGTRLIEPINDFLNMVLRCLLTSKKSREDDANENAEIMKYIQLSEVLEKGILRGSVDFTGTDIENQKQLVFSHSKDVAIDISIVSSMVKELAPLVLCLRYLAEPDEFLIIDEPEMNLHPEAQAKFVEFLALLVNSGLRVLITTHSSYFVDHLSNLIRAYDSPNKENLASMFFLQNPNAFLNKDLVSIYLFEGGSARSILQDSGDIDWGTFSNVSDKISQINLAI